MLGFRHSQPSGQIGRTCAEDDPKPATPVDRPANGPGGGEGMTRTMRRSPILALLATTAIIFAACDRAASAPRARTARTRGTRVAPASAEPYVTMSYPEDGTSSSDIADYAGQIASIKTLD